METNNHSTPERAAIAPSEIKQCFVIMPISDPEGYPDGHFRHVYDNIIKPACEKASYEAVRADDEKSSSLIHLDILKLLIEAPLAICDLSSRNPNVLFELGIRQAFDKPVVLIQERGTPRIFDIAPLRFLEYSKEMKYHDVLQSQNDLKAAIEATIASDSDSSTVNSIVKMLAISEPAKIPSINKGDKSELAIEILHAEVQDIKRMIKNISSSGRAYKLENPIVAIEYNRILSALDKIINAKLIPESEKMAQLHRLLREAEEVSRCCDSPGEVKMFRRLIRDLSERAVQEEF